MGRIGIFVVQCVWLLVLGTLAAIFFIHRSWIPLGDSLGPIPLAAIWFGALGAVLISLTGIVDHAHDWDKSYALWHLSRPLVGASLAVVGVLVFKSGVLAVGANPSPRAGETAQAPASSPAPQSPAPAQGNPGTSTTPSNSGSGAGANTSPASTPIPQNLLYYLVAFLIGYREETFRELMKRLVDLILTPAGSRAAPSVTGLAPRTGPVGGGGSVVISGSGFVGTTSVKFGDTPADYRVDSDSQITATPPKAATPGPVSVSVSTKTGSAGASYTYQP